MIRRGGGPRGRYDYFQNGPNTGDGLYTIDTDGSGAKPPVQVYCGKTNGCSRAHSGMRVSRACERAGCLLELGAMRMRLAMASLCLAGCYTGAPANRDVSTSWLRRPRVELVDRWGQPAARDPQLLTWTFDRTDVELPSADLHVEARPAVLEAGVAGPNGRATIHAQATLISAAASFHPGALVKVTTAAVASIDPADRIAGIEGAALHWGPPNDVNLHWGTIFGAHVGLGRLDTTGTPLPSGGAYIGGMLTPTLGLAGVYELAAGTGDSGSAMGMAGGVAAVYWPVNRFSVHAGPALLLAFDPGFTNARLRPGAVAGASYALIKIGVLAIDLRVDVAGGPSTAFGTAGVGINVN